MAKKSTLLASLLIFALPFVANAIKSNGNEVAYENGCISFQHSDISLATFLEVLTKAANLELVLIEPLDKDKRIQVQFNQVPLHQVLYSTLRDYSYAVIITSPESECSSIDSYNVNKHAVGGTLSRESRLSGPSAAADSLMNEQHKKKLIIQIDNLQQRIEEGVSDIGYEKWARVRNPEYVGMIETSWIDCSSCLTRWIESNESISLSKAC